MPENKTGRIIRSLVVESTEHKAQTLAIVLRLMGHEVDVTSTVSEAIKRAVFFPPDVVLINLSLGRTQGDYVCGEILNRLRPGQPRPLMIGIAGDSSGLGGSFNARFEYPIEYPKLAAVITDFFKQKGAHAPTAA
jgi:CheY-like chemotaxis protein